MVVAPAPPSFLFLVEKTRLPSLVDLSHPESQNQDGDF